MFNITRLAGARVARRNFLQVGLLGPLGLSLPVLASATRAAEEASGAAARGTFGRAKRCILVYLNGGPSQLDTWDMKPDAPQEIRGELRPIASSVPGLQVSELYPKIAAQAHRFKVVRTVTHTASVHTTGVYTMLTGTYHATPKVDQTRITSRDHPHLGSILALARGWRDRLPPFVSLPMLFRAPPVEGIWPGQNAGFLGRRYDPFVITGERETARFSMPEVELPASVTPDRLADRQTLLRRLDETFRQAEASGVRAQKELLWSQAYSMLDASRLTTAADLSREPNRERYGNHLFGQGLLLARRLVEVGVPLVTVYWIDPTPAGAGGGEYDSHGRIYHHMRNRLAAPTDMGLAALFQDVFERGLDRDTLVVVMSEFGRSPKINADAGRDHWPEAQSILLAGAGVSGGAIHGATDKQGGAPISDAVTPPDLGQSILHLLGVPADLELHDSLGRPFRASQGTVDHKLIA